MLSAAELHRRGLESANAGRHRAAQRYLSTALERAGDAESAARIELSLAYTESELGTADRGLARCQHVLEQTGISVEVRGLAWSQLGMLRMRTGEGDGALEALSRAERLLEPTAHEPLGRLFLTRGNVHLQRHEVARALADFERSEHHFDAADMPVQRVKAMHNLGYTHLLAGDLPTALRLMDAARPTFASLSPVYDAVGAQDRAEALMAAGMPDEAAEALRASSRAFASRSMRQRQAEALLVLARLLLSDEPREARKTARRAARLFSARGSDVWALRAESVAVTAEILSGVRTQALLTRATDLAEQLRSHGLAQDAGALTLQSARVALARHASDRARSLAASVRVTPSSPLEHRLLSREVRSELAAAGRRRAKALTHVRHGLRDLLEWQASFGSLDLRTSLAQHGGPLVVQGLSLSIDDGRPEVVFEWAERARALASRVAPIRPPADPEAASRLIELRELHNVIRMAEESGQPAPAAQRRARTLRDEIRQHAWNDVGSGVINEPATLDQVLQELEPAEGTLVALMVVGQDLHALVAGRGAPAVVELGTFGPVRELLQGMQADLDMAGAHLPKPLRQVVLHSLGARLAKLDRHLLTPLGIDGDGPVVLVPAGGLAGTPWSMLPTLRGRPLTVPRSATLWCSRRKVTAPPRRAGFVAGPRVGRAEEEVRSAALAWPDHQVLTGGDANAAAVSELASSVDVLHVAAHGRHAAGNPLFSGLELEDGPWFGYDVDNLRSIPSTVVLSACEVGRSTLRWGEEAIGMTAAWLHAGAQAVIASPASVDDDVASAVLSQIHAGLAAGRPAAEALAAVTAELTDETPCPFVCFGAGW